MHQQEKEQKQPAANNKKWRQAYIKIIVKQFLTRRPLHKIPKQLQSESPSKGCFSRYSLTFRIFVDFIHLHNNRNPPKAETISSKISPFVNSSIITLSFLNKTKVSQKPESKQVEPTDKRIPPDEKHPHHHAYRSQETSRKREYRILSHPYTILTEYRHANRYKQYDLSTIN